MIPIKRNEIAPDFDHPLEILHACHGKIQHQLDTLQKLAIYLPVHGCDLQARQAAQAILRYFDTAGQFHHQDEEENLFPTLLAMDISLTPRIQALVNQLLEQHVVMFAAWGEVRIVLVKLADGIDTPLQDVEVAHLVDSYNRHIKIEESELLPLSAHVLSPNQVMELGKAMAERRGVKFPA
jgi:pyridoxamine 5'-phosphate oxidase